MDCHPAATRSAPEGPQSWGQSASAIDGFCNRVLTAGYAASLFLAPRCAGEHEPLVEEMASAGVEVGLFVQPQTMYGRGFSRFLGQYRREEQYAIVAAAVEEFQDVVGHRPQSVRPAMYSASDDTFGVLFEHGFRQGSVSSPGRRVTKHGAIWTAAAQDPHYVDPRSRLRSGDLPFFEIPLTTDATQERGGLSPELAIENGTFTQWHKPLIDAQLQRMEAENVSFRCLCFVTRNCFGYHVDDDQRSRTLDSVIQYLDSLGERYEVTPTTIAGAHAFYRTGLTPGPSPSSIERGG